MVNVISERRQHFIAESKLLLWESLEAGNNTPENIQNLQFESAEIFFDDFLILLHSSFCEIANENEKNLFQYGCFRRAQAIRSALADFLEIAFPKRRKILNSSEHTKLANCLLLIYVHVPAFFDNFSLLVFERAKPPDFSEREANIFDRTFLKKCKLPRLREDLRDFGSWNSRLRKELRHRFVHRIPPYVAPSIIYGEEKSLKAKAIVTEADSAMSVGDFDGYLNKMREVDDLGEFSPFIFFFENGGQMPLIATVLDDLIRFQMVAIMAIERWSQS